MPIKKATKDKLVAAHDAGYRAGYADGQRATEVRLDSFDAAGAVFEKQLDSENGEDAGE